MSAHEYLSTACWDPDTAHRGAELARDLLKRTTEGDRP